MWAKTRKFVGDGILEKRQAFDLSNHLQPVSVFKLLPAAGCSRRCFETAATASLCSRPWFETAATASMYDYQSELSQADIEARMLKRGRWVKAYLATKPYLDVKQILDQNNELVESFKVQASPPVMPQANIDCSKRGWDSQRYKFRTKLRVWHEWILSTARDLLDGLSTSKHSDQPV